ncbi:hypothetical protein [Nocardia carnea]|uniref:hypothetical protein n=1 Tax=Nocardia carnea TaxID=37328 RepID=UPI00245906D5|nr:hypothetical protein [Nocardia carnea]
MSVLFVSANGLEGDGVFTLVLGAVAVLVLFTMVSTSRELPAPIPWIVPGAALICLIVAMVDIGEILRGRSDGGGEVGLQVGWGLWLVALSAAVLCLTSTMVAARSGPWPHRRTLRLRSRHTTAGAFPLLPMSAHRCA